MAEDFVPSGVLQGAALWLLLLAALLAQERSPAPPPAPPPEPPDWPIDCPFCGAPFDGRRLCWCGSDGHWL